MASSFPRLDIIQREDNVSQLVNGLLIELHHQNYLHGVPHCFLAVGGHRLWNTALSCMQAHDSFQIFTSLCLPLNNPNSKYYSLL